jgi:hypothetical protein
MIEFVYSFSSSRLRVVWRQKDEAGVCSRGANCTKRELWLILVRLGFEFFLTFGINFDHPGRFRRSSGLIQVRGSQERWVCKKQRPLPPQEASSIAPGAGFRTELKSGYDLGSPPASFWGFVTFSYLAPLIAAPRRF